MNWWTFWQESVLQAFFLLFSGDPYVWSTIGVSLYVSGLALLFATMMGIPLAALLVFKKFPGREVFRLLLYTGMGFPSVIVGLLVLLLLTQRGPLGQLNWLWTPEAMILAQCALILPLLTGVTLSALEAVDPALAQVAATLGARPVRQVLVVMEQARRGLITAILSGFGRAISEVGAVLIVGGNIVWSNDVSYTRTLTTAIVVETRQGKFETALALGLILFGIVLLVNLTVLRLGRRQNAEPTP